MLKPIMTALAATFFATSAMAVGIQIQEGKELVAPTPLVKLNVVVKNSADISQKITLETLNRSPWNSKVVNFPRNNFKLLSGGDQTSLPMLLKIKQRGKFKIVVCAAEEPFKYKKETKDGVEVNVTVRACDSIIVNRK